MIPAVYVTATKTLYWEQSCGSGSAATAAALSQLCGHEIACEIRQPGGMITIEAAVSDGEIKKIHIGGPVAPGKGTMCTALGRYAKEILILTRPGLALYNNTIVM